MFYPFLLVISQKPWSSLYVETNHVIEGHPLWHTSWIFLDNLWFGCNHVIYPRIQLQSLGMDPTFLAKLDFYRMGHWRFKYMQCLGCLLLYLPFWSIQIYCSWWIHVNVTKPWYLEASKNVYSPFSNSLWVKPTFVTWLRLEDPCNVSRH